MADNMGMEHQREVYEKTWFEKVEETMKTGVFGVFFLLLKDNETSVLKITIILILDFLQLEGLTVNSNIDFPWRGGSVSSGIEQVLGALRILNWCKRINWTTYIVVFYLTGGYILLTMFNFVYVSLCYSRKKAPLVWPLQLLRNTSYMFITILFIPVIELLTSILSCEDNNQGISVNIYFSSHECWTGFNIFHGFMSIIMSITFALLCFLICLLFYEHRADTLNSNAKISSRADVLILLFKFIMVIMFAFFTNEDQMWMNSLILLFGSIMILFRAITERPYHNEFLSSLCVQLSGIYAWSNCVLIICMIMRNESFTGGIQLLFLGIPIVIILISLLKDRRKNLLIQPILQFESDFALFNCIRYYTRLLETKDTNRHNYTYLKGIIYEHNDICKEPDCPIKIYVQNANTILKEQRGANRTGKLKTTGNLSPQSIDRNSKPIQRNNSNVFQLLSINSDNLKLLLAYANKMFCQGLKKFESSTLLRISYAQFLIDKINNQNLAISELLIAERWNPSIDQQFIIFRMRQMIESEINELSIGNNTTDYASVMNYSNQQKQCKKNIEYVSYLHVKFWSLLLEESLDLKKLSKTGVDINRAISAVEENWNRMQKMYKDCGKALKMYGEYQLEILNDKEGGMEYINRAKDAVNSKPIYSGSLTSAISSSEDNACVAISGDQQKLGEIINLNMSLCRAFGYTKTELLSKNLEILLPDIYAKHHHSFLIRAANTTTAAQVSNEMFLLGKHKSGYLLPFWKQVKSHPSISEGIQFLATFKGEKKASAMSNIGYILLDNSLYVQAVSASCITMLGINNKLLRLGKILFSNLAPEMFDVHYNHQYIDKTGGIANIFFPEAIIVAQEDEGTNRKDSVGDSSEFENRNQLRIKAGDKSVRMMAQMSELMFTDIGKVGNIIRLETIAENKSLIHLPKKPLIQPDFQFSYDPLHHKYLRQEFTGCPVVSTNELQEYSDLFREEKKTPTSSFRAIITNTPRSKHLYKRNFSGDLEQSKIIDVWEINQLDTMLNEENEEKDLNKPPKTQNTGLTDLSINPNVDRSADDTSQPTARTNITKNPRNINYAEGILTYQLINTEFIEVETTANEMLKREEETKKELEVRGEEKMEEHLPSQVNKSLHNTIRSRAQLAAALGSKVVPISIKRLKYIFYVLLFLILTIASIDYFLSVYYFEYIKDSLFIIYYSALRMEVLIKTIISTRNIILILGTERPYLIRNNEFYNRQKEIIRINLELLYYAQNEVIMSNIPISEEHEDFINGKNTPLYYLSMNGIYEPLEYTLGEAILEISSAIFGIYNAENATFNIKNKDIEFLFYNGFGNLYLNIEKSTTLYNTDLEDTSTKVSKIIIGLLVGASGLLFLSLGILIPIINYVSKSKEEALGFFLEIPMRNLRILYHRCELFYNRISDERGEGEGGSMEDPESEMEGDLESNKDEEDILVAGNSRRKRKFKNRISANFRLFFYFFVIILLLVGYFMFNYFVSDKFLRDSEAYSREINATSFSSPEYSWQLAYLLELYAYGNTTLQLINPNIGLLERLTLEIDKTYERFGSILDIHKENEGGLMSSYNNEFENILSEDLCEYSDKFQFNFTCTEFLAGVMHEGLHTVQILYAENIRESLNYYLEISNQGTDISSPYVIDLRHKYLNSYIFLEYDLIVSEILPKCYEHLGEYMMDTYKDMFNTRVGVRMAFYILLWVIIAIGLLTLWLPFINNLITEVWRAKSILTIIPIEVIAKMNSVNQFINNQTSMELSTNINS